ncbi:MAG: septation protein A [Variibacter sp.]|nr:septation protein A [Variibacter sp.]
MAEQKQLNPLARLALDLGPLALFFFVNGRWGIFAGTGVFMAAALAAIVVSYALTRHLPIMAMVSAVVVLVFGGLTLALHDETFIKLKPTIIYLLFAALLLGGLAFGKSLLALVLDAMLELDAEGWRKLTLRWGLFFVVLAGLNEIVWRTQTTDFWIGFKAFTVFLSFVFAAAQYPLMKRHALPGSPLRGEE